MKRWSLVCHKYVICNHLGRPPPICDYVIYGRPLSYIVHAGEYWRICNMRPPPNMNEKGSSLTVAIVIFFVCCPHCHLFIQQQYFVQRARPVGARGLEKVEAMHRVMPSGAITYCQCHRPHRHHHWCGSYKSKRRGGGAAILLRRLCMTSDNAQ